MTELRLRIIPTTTISIDQDTPRTTSIELPNMTTDWTSIANHGSVLGCAGYAITNFMRAFIITITLEDSFVDNVLMFVLAFIIAVDAGIYWRAIYCDRLDRLRDRSSSNRSHSKEVEAIPLSSLSGHDHLDMNHPTPPSPLTRIHRIICCTNYHLHHPNHPHPLSAESIAEILNVIGSVGYVISALVPLTSSVARNADELRFLTKWGNIIDTMAMLAFLIGGFVYAITWQRDDEERQLWTTRWKWEGAPHWFNRWVGLKDWNWWAMTSNLLAGFGYLGSTLYGLIIESTLASDPSTSPDDQLRHVYRYLAHQRQAAFIGDLLYLISSIAMEIAYYQDRAILMKLAATTSDTYHMTSRDRRRDVDVDIEMEESRSHRTVSTHDQDIQRLLPSSSPGSTSIHRSISGGPSPSAAAYVSLNSTSSSVPTDIS